LLEAETLDELDAYAAAQLPVREATRARASSSNGAAAKAEASDVPGSPDAL
jgi:hypothetical protein